ncbi:MAG: hypothetical protein LBQ22_07070 [Bacteroidales bacterium]|jgi:hypothetical protein|nr:hypothetical protein [Bacteroidales bacterium]
MALEAKLKIDGKGTEYDILECEYEFIQPMNNNGLPAGRPSGGLIHFIIIHNDDNDLLFHEWMIHKTDCKNGKLIFHSTKKNGSISKKTVSFENAYCVRLYEYFNKHNDTEMYMKITISANKIFFGEEERENTTYNSFL